MTTWERFPKAPIAEALLDIQVSFVSPIDPARLESFHHHIRDRYPTKQGRVKWAGEIQLSGEALQQAIRRGPEGFSFKSSDGHRIVQARQDGFTFNWVKPYDRWETFRNEAREHWEHFRREDFLDLKRKYGVGWVVVERPGVSGLPCPYGNAHLMVCRIE